MYNPSQEIKAIDRNGYSISAKVNGSATALRMSQQRHLQSEGMDRVLLFLQSSDSWRGEVGGVGRSVGGGGGWGDEKNRSVMPVES